MNGIIGFAQKFQIQIFPQKCVKNLFQSFKDDHSKKKCLRLRSIFFLGMDQRTMEHICMSMENI